MNKNHNEIRIKKIYQTLFEIATGNLAFRIELDDYNDELSELTSLINNLAEKMQQFILESDYITPNYNFSNTTTSKQSDAELLQKLHEYILNHIEDPLPSTKELSKIFGTNEFRLKDSFRRFFNTSIYQFYTEERLKRAHSLITKTSIPIKEIAFMSGFNDYTNFYKSFKKKYGYPPSNLNRITE